MIIEKNIPIPEKCGGNNRYPIPMMEVGDSFLIDAKKEDTQKVRNKVQSSLTHHSRSGKEFTCRAVDGGLRVWRTA